MEPVCGKTIDAQETILLAVVDTLSQIAATEVGRKFLLWGELNYTGSRLKISPLAANHTLQIITNLVLNNLGEFNSKSLTKKVLGQYIFLLRQFYRTGHGLMVLSDFKLHLALSNCRNKLSEDEKKTEWGICLVDNLLNFGATPAGVFLLHESGSMETCVAYMFSRYQKKLKVSECEKFGYGTLVSQISSTKPGMEALCKAGWISASIDELWNLLECSQPFGPHIFDINDKISAKSITNILKLMTTFPGIRACLANEKEPTRGTFTDLLTTLAFLNYSKKSSLFNFEDSHQVGLRILKHIVSSLDSSIFLDVKFNYIECLIREISDFYIPG